LGWSFVDSLSYPFVFGRASFGPAAEVPPAPAQNDMHLLLSIIAPAAFVPGWQLAFLPPLRPSLQKEGNFFSQVDVAQTVHMIS
jgi:hypothetical protein